MNNTLNKNNDVVKRNILNQLCTEQYTLPELRLFAVYLSRIDTRDSSTSPQSRTVRFSLDEFKELTGLKRVCKSDLLPSLKHLLDRQRIEESPGSTEDNCKVRLFNLFSGAYFEKNKNGENFVEISATDEAIPYLFNIKREFVKYKLWNILQLTSKNQIRMYEVLKQYLTAGRFECDLQRLKYLLGIPAEKYPDFRNLKRSVIDKCQEALKKHTDICFTYENAAAGIGGKWETIIFHIKKNETSTAAEYEKSLRAYIDIEAETRAAVFTLESTGNELTACGDPAGALTQEAADTTRRTPRKPRAAAQTCSGDDLKAEQSTAAELPSSEPQSVMMKDSLRKAAQLINDNELKAKFEEFAAELEAEENERKYQEMKAETFGTYGIEESFSFDDTLEIVYNMQEKGYKNILASYKRIHRTAMNKCKDKSKLKGYMLSIIANDTKGLETA